MDSMNAQQVMSGTEGEVWIDGNYMAQVTSFKAEVNLIKEEVNQVKKRGKNSIKLPDGRVKELSR